MTTLDHTHNVQLKSWVASANDPGSEFPIQNLPLGVFRRAGSSERFRPGAAIGDHILDLLKLRDAGLLTADAHAALEGTDDGSLNALMARGRPASVALRRCLSEGLTEGAAERQAWQDALVARALAEMTVPARIGDYTDFYTSIHHATAVGKMFRPDNPLLPNYRWVPIGYHGRASSIGVSGQQFRRPRGQSKLPDDATPVLRPSERLDYELELGVFISRPNALGEPVSMDDAEEHLFGMCLFNDWSARDIQAWEYQPLGPFLSKNFASTVSPWIVTMEALAPFRCAFGRADGEPQPLPYLDGAFNRRQGAFDIQLEAWLQTETMRAEGVPHQRLMQSNFQDSYWTIAQLLTHHTVNGCNLQPGDMLGSGTQSGPATGQGGSMLELSAGGKKPLTLDNGEQRSFLMDGDSVMLLGRAQRLGFRSIGFGACEGRVLPALHA